ncbi:MAG TPA: hypothetical protein VMV92_20055 [Streptosporangiaceae bacterium]|nr:hypothetical protein [Streptosporangiaceae bacterium]
MTGRVTWGLIMAVFDAFEAAGFRRADDQHTGQAIGLLSDLAKIYAGELDQPAGAPGTARAALLAEPVTAAGPDGSAVIAAADLGTVLGALSDAVAWCEDDEDCQECAAAPAGLCESHDARLARVPAYRMLARTLGDDR